MSKVTIGKICTKDSLTWHFWWVKWHHFAELMAILNDKLSKFFFGQRISAFSHTVCFAKLSKTPLKIATLQSSENYWALNCSVLFLSAIWCSINDLPNVSNGFFECPNYSHVRVGRFCTLSCAKGFHPASIDKAMCQEGIHSQVGKWSDGNFTCHGEKL